MIKVKDMCTWRRKKRDVCEEVGVGCGEGEAKVL